MTDGLVRTGMPGRRRRWLVAVAAACVVAALAVGAAVIARGTGGSHRREHPATAAVSARTLAMLRRSALAKAIAGGDPYASADAVRTTLRQALAVMNGRADPREPDDPIWLVQVHGYRLHASRWAPSDARASASYLRFSLPIGPLRTSFQVSSDRSADLAGLGTVVHVLRPGAAAADLARVRSLAVAAARANGDPAARIEAVRTTLARAETVADDGRSNVADRPVWLIQAAGHFACSSCSRPSREQRSPTGRYLTLIEPAHPGGGDVSAFGLDNTRLNLAMLGPVITLQP